MMVNRIFQEGVKIYLVEGHAFIAYFLVLLLVGPLQFFTLVLPSLDSQIWMAPANLFRVSSVGALIVVVYLGLKIANQELVPWRFLPLKLWIRQEGASAGQITKAHMALLGLHSLLLVFVSCPLLLWAGAISRVPLGSILCTFLLLIIYAVVYGAWGLFALTVWENRVENRKVFVRCFLVSTTILSILLYQPMNPIAFLWYYLEGREYAPLAISGLKLPAPAAHFLFHGFIFGAGVLAYRRALLRRANLD
ncbi:MAG: hypothetical protein HY695_29340 [Deltaproteobacteria bacterium]|nr:hypothetical protein [Deltaproteobacteria bacterium]